MTDRTGWRRRLSYIGMVLKGPRRTYIGSGILALLVLALCLQVLLAANAWDLERNCDRAYRPRKLLLVNVMTVAGKRARRQLLRDFYSLTAPASEVDVRFVIGANVSAHGNAFELALEQSAHGDLTILEAPENMNDGKTLDMIIRSSADAQKAASRNQRGRSTTYDFLVKTDDDTFVHLPNLVSRAASLPKKETYFGRYYDKWFMTGMIYLLSWDLVDQLAANAPDLDRVGNEDLMVAVWLNKLQLAENRISEETELYDYPSTTGGWAHPFTPGTIAVHLCKSDESMLDAMSHFYPSMTPRPRLS